MKTEKEMRSLMKECLHTVNTILIKNAPMKVPQTDEIIDIIFCYFIENSVRSLPKKLRKQYVEMRLVELSGKLMTTLEDFFKGECEACKNGTHDKQTIH